MLRAGGLSHGERVEKCLAFIGVLQQYAHEPPPLPLFGSPRIVTTPPMQHGAVIVDPSPPSFTRERWLHFHSRRFLALYQRYARFHHRVQQFNGSAQIVTLCWRRSWEGAIARTCTSNKILAEPPFGVAEWWSFAPHADHRTPEEVDQARLSLRFEQDLQLTWNAWANIIGHLGSDAHTALHPQLIPPRACWMAEPPELAESPALGIF